MRFPDSVSDDAIVRLRRVEGQVRGLQRLIDEGAECAEIVTQLAAVKGAIDRVGFKLMAAALANAGDDADLGEMEKLFLKLT